MKYLLSLSVVLVLSASTQAGGLHFGHGGHHHHSFGSLFSHSLFGHHGHHFGHHSYHGHSGFSLGIGLGSGYYRSYSRSYYPRYSYYSFQPRVRYAAPIQSPSCVSTYVVSPRVVAPQVVVPQVVVPQVVVPQQDTPQSTHQHDETPKKPIPVPQAVPDSEASTKRLSPLRNRLPVLTVGLQNAPRNVLPGTRRTTTKDSGKASNNFDSRLGPTLTTKYQSSLNDSSSPWVVSDEPSLDVAKRE